MEEYNREVADLKAVVTKALEGKGTLAKIRAQLRASIFEAVEEQDKAAGENGRKAVVGGCSEKAKAVHATKHGQMLTALICEYLEWAELDHTVKVYQSEANLQLLPKSRGKLEEELGLPPSAAAATPAQRPVLLDVLEGFISSKASPAKPQAPTAAALGSGRVQGGSPSSARLHARSSSPTIRRDLSTNNIRSVSPARVHRTSIGTPPSVRKSWDMTPSGASGAFKSGSGDRA